MSLTRKYKIILTLNDVQTINFSNIDGPPMCSFYGTAIY